MIVPLPGGPTVHRNAVTAPPAVASQHSSQHTSAPQHDARRDGRRQEGHRAGRGRRAPSARRRGPAIARQLRRARETGGRARAVRRASSLCRARPRVWRPAADDEPAGRLRVEKRSIPTEKERTLQLDRCGRSISTIDRTKPVESFIPQVKKCHTRKSLFPVVASRDLRDDRTLRDPAGHNSPRRTHGRSRQRPFREHG